MLVVSLGEVVWNITHFRIFMRMDPNLPAYLFEYEFGTNCPTCPLGFLNRDDDPMEILALRRIGDTEIFQP